nr:DUF1566 domain-containing protein [Orrella dioscoreae]
MPIIPRRLPPALVLAACTALAQAQCPPAQPDRYRIQGAQVADRATGLEWQRCSMGTTVTASGQCQGVPALLSLPDAGKAAASAGQGWRLPTAQELLTLVTAPGCPAPTLDAAVFPGLADLGDGIPYWSDTPADLPVPMRMHYYVDFADGRVDAHTLGFPLAVRLVRGGAGQ